MRWFQVVAIVAVIAVSCLVHRLTGTFGDSIIGWEPRHSEQGICESSTSWREAVETRSQNIGQDTLASIREMLRRANLTISAIIGITGVAVAGHADPT
jgi:hypothetical protein